MWYDDPFVKLKKKKRNRRRRMAHDPILMVNARTAEVRKERVQRLGALVLCLLALGGVCWLAVTGGRYVGRRLFSENPRYQVLKFGAGSDGSRVNAQRIREFTELGENVNLFAINLGDIRERLEDVPVIKTARIQRKLPHTLKIWVAERIAIARPAGKRKLDTWAIDKEGHILGPGVHYPSLPLIEGADMHEFKPRSGVSSSQVLDAVKLLETVDAESPLSHVLRIEKIDVSDVNYMELYLEEKRSAMIGRVNTDKKLRDLAAMIQHADSAGMKLKTFDVRVDENQPVR